MPREARVAVQAVSRSTNTGPAVPATPSALPRSRATCSSRASLTSISRRTGGSSITRSATRRPGRADDGLPGRIATGRGSTYSRPRAASSSSTGFICSLAPNRSPRRPLRPPSPPHSRRCATASTQPLVVLRRRQPGQQRARAGIVQRVAERLHRDGHQGFMADGARDLQQAGRAAAHRARKPARSPVGWREWLPR